MKKKVEEIHILSKIYNKDYIHLTVSILYKHSPYCFYKQETIRIYKSLDLYNYDTWFRYLDTGEYISSDLNTIINNRLSAQKARENFDKSVKDSNEYRSVGPKT